MTRREERLFTALGTALELTCIVAAAIAVFVGHGA